MQHSVKAESCIDVLICDKDRTALGTFSKEGSHRLAHSFLPAQLQCVHNRRAQARNAYFIKTPVFCNACTTQFLAPKMAE